MWCDSERCLVLYHLLHRPPLTVTLSLPPGAFPAAVLYARKDRLHRPSHVATKTFQALRIFVNDELNELHAGLRAARAALRPGGRFCIVTFHSLEDRLVKRFLRGDDLSNLDQYHFSPRKQDVEREDRREGGDGCWIPLRRKVITPEKDDVKENPRGRSAKLRAVLRRWGFKLLPLLFCQTFYTSIVKNTRTYVHS